MRNRPDISYLTLIGLSLTVVIAMQKGDSCEDRVRFKLSDSDGHHICFLSVDAIRDAFLAVAHEKTSFVFGYHASSYPLASPVKVLVDIKAFCLGKAVETVIGHKVLTKDIIPDSSCLITPALSPVDRLVNARFSVLRRNDLRASHYSSAFPVRAGPAMI